MQFQAIASSSNCFPKPHPPFREHDWEPFSKPIPNTPEALRDELEILSHGYDGQGIREDGKRFSGPHAFNIWKSRLAEAGTAIPLEPRLSKLFYYGVPPEITGNATIPFPAVYKGQTLTIDHAIAIAGHSSGLRVSVEIDEGYGHKKQGNLGWLTGGGSGGSPELYAFSPGRSRYGFSVPPTAIITALETVTGKRRFRTDYGHLIAMESVPEFSSDGTGTPMADYDGNIKTEPGRIAAWDPRIQRTDLIVCRDKDGKVLTGPAGNHRTETMEGMATYGSVYSHSEAPSCFSLSAAKDILTRLNILMPESQWEGILLADFCHEICTLHEQLCAKASRPSAIPLGMNPCKPISSATMAKPASVPATPTPAARSGPSTVVKLESLPSPVGETSMARANLELPLDL